MSNIDWSAIRADYEGGMSLRPLAAKYGVSKSTIERHAKMGQWDNQVGQRDIQQAQIDTNPTVIKKNLSTKDVQRLFLDAFSEHANVLMAARAAGIHRSTVYDWLEHDQDFSFVFNQAKEAAKDVLRAEIYRRGKEGWDEPVFQQGKFVDTVRKFDSTLLMFHAKMMMPEYREKQSLEVTSPGTVEVYKVRIPDNGRNDS